MSSSWTRISAAEESRGVKRGEERGEEADELIELDDVGRGGGDPIGSGGLPQTILQIAMCDRVGVWNGCRAPEHMMD